VQIALYVIGKTNLQGVQPLIDEYSKRVNRFVKFEMLVLADIKNAGSQTVDILVDKEGVSFLSNIKRDDFVVILDERGTQLSSIAFADKLQDMMSTARGRIVFLIGGAYGFSQDVINRSNYSLSLSKMTFNHQMVRAIFIEQLYRSIAILKGLPYHHE